MKKLHVRVVDDHIETLARTKPMTALAELIWNALDADAREVRVIFDTNALDGIEAIHVVDNGGGLPYAEAVRAFECLGGSWKRQGSRLSAEHRQLHGRYGKGRFRAFSLGSQVTWTSTFGGASGLRSFSIHGRIERLGEFELSEESAAAQPGTGMRVSIFNPHLSAELLRGVKAQQEATEIFALYLRQYPGVRIVYDGTPLDAANAERRLTEYALEELVTENGDRVQATLTVVEWDIPGKRGLYLCNESGFMRHPALPRLHFRGFSYTAYLKSAFVERLEREGLLDAEELASDVRLLLEAARAKLREHFTLREAEHAQEVLEMWKEDGLYPYLGAPKTPDEMTERRIFDIYATHLNQIFPDFARASYRSKKLTLTLLQELVRSEPTRAARVLDAVLHFPEEKEEEILQLVQA